MKAWSTLAVDGHVMRSAQKRLMLQVTGKRWRRVYVTAAQFEAWLAQRDNTPQRHRDYVKMLLGRMPPERDFKRGLSAR